LRTSTVTKGVDLSFSHRQLLRNRVAFDLQLAQLAVTKTVFALARVAPEIKFVHVITLTQLLTHSHPRQRIVAVAAFCRLILDLHESSAQQEIGLRPEGSESLLLLVKLEVLLAILAPPSHHHVIVEQLFTPAQRTQQQNHHSCRETCNHITAVGRRGSRLSERTESEKSAAPFR
jgi:hypothetical protein